MMVMMTMMMKTQNGHNPANFEATSSGFCMVIGLNDINRMMLTMMMMIRMMKTQNGDNSANFEATTFRFCMVIDINDTYRIIMMYQIILTLLWLFMIRGILIP